MQGELKAVATLVGNDPFYPILLRLMTGEKHGGYPETKLVVHIQVGRAFQLYRQIITQPHLWAPGGNRVQGESIESSFGYGAGIGKSTIQLPIFFPFHVS